MTTLCPHCGEPYDASARATGDRVWHPACSQWFLVVHRDGLTELRPCEVPVTWPSTARRPPSDPPP